MKYKIIWLTGHSGSGKTTIAKNLCKKINAIMLDGDEMRNSISLNYGYSKTRRRDHNLKIARLAKELSKQTNIIVSVISPMINVRKEIDNICNPIWIYCKRKLPRRDWHFYEVGEYNLTINNDKFSVDENVEKIRYFLRKH